MFTKNNFEISITSEIKQEVNFANSVEFDAQIWNIENYFYRFQNSIKRAVINPFALCEADNYMEQLGYLVYRISLKEIENVQWFHDFINSNEFKEYKNSIISDSPNFYLLNLKKQNQKKYNKFILLNIVFNLFIKPNEEFKKFWLKECFSNKKLLACCHGQNLSDFFDLNKYFGWGTELYE